VFLKHEKNDGIAVYVSKETILKEMAAKIKLSQHFFFVLVWELSERTSYMKKYKVMTASIYGLFKKVLNYFL
jgi:hypothetical protein